MTAGRSSYWRTATSALRWKVGKVRCSQLRSSSFFTLLPLECHIERCCWRSVSAHSIAAAVLPAMPHSMRRDMAPHCEQRCRRATELRARSCILSVPRVWRRVLSAVLLAQASARCCTAGSCRWRQQLSGRGSAASSCSCWSCSPAGALLQAICCLKKASLCWPTAAFHQLCLVPWCAPRRPGRLVAPGNPFCTDAAALHLPCSACWCSAVRLNQSLAAGRNLSAANRHGVQMQLQGASHKV